jgi:hypothetical protein
MKKVGVTGISLRKMLMNLRCNAGQEMLPFRAIASLGQAPCIPLLQADASRSGVCLWWDPKFPKLTYHWKMSHMIT